jgi:4-hydroxy-4-methyl-2-oxoglutarate aldolase
VTRPVGSVDADAAELATLGTATLYEALKLNCVLPHRIRPVWPGALIVGRALPVRTAVADNLPLHRALTSAAPGDVLVIDGAREPCGYWGEILTVAAMRVGIVGLVIDGGVRDVSAMEELGFPVFASAIAVRTTVKHWPGTVGEPIALDGVPVMGGDLVVADVDGVVAIPAAREREVVEAARKRAADEHRHLARIRAGESTLDLYDLRQLLT